jgi:hypothetical protein
LHQRGEKLTIRRQLDVQAGDVVALDAVYVPELALGVDRTVKRAHNLADLDSVPTVVQLAEAHRLVVGARSGPLLDPAGAHVLFAVQPARVVGPVDVIAHQRQQGSTFWLF